MDEASILFLSFPVPFFFRRNLSFLIFRWGKARVESKERTGEDKKLGIAPLPLPPPFPQPLILFPLPKARPKRVVILGFMVAFPVLLFFSPPFLPPVPFPSSFLPRLTDFRRELGNFKKYGKRFTETQFVPTAFSRPLSPFPFFPPPPPHPPPTHVTLKIVKLRRERKNIKLIGRIRALPPFSFFPSPRMSLFLKEVTSSWTQSGAVSERLLFPLPPFPPTYFFFFPLFFPGQAPSKGNHTPRRQTWKFSVA